MQASTACAFLPVQQQQQQPISHGSTADVLPMSATRKDGNGHDSRRSFLSSIVGGCVLLSSVPVFAEEEESFASIAARAAKLSSDVGEKTPLAAPKSDDPRTAYDFSLPVAGETVEFRDIVKQVYDDEGRSRVKAILVINMKEDDPIARKDIPELISLATK